MYNILWCFIKKLKMDLKNHSFSSVQSLSCVWLFATLWTAASQASLSITNPRSLPKLVSIESVMPSNHLILCRPLLLLPASGSFPMTQFFTLVGQKLGVSASASVLPMNIQDQFPLGLTDFISLQSKGLSRVFPNTTVLKHKFFSLLYGPTLTSAHNYWKNHSFEYTDLCQQSDIYASEYAV